MAVGRSKQTYVHISYFKCPSLKFSEFEVKMSKRKCQLSIEPTKVQLETKHQKLVTVQFQNLPDEIILKVMSNLSVEELIQWGQVSKRIRNISHDVSLWQEVDIFEKKVSTDFVKMILSNGCEYLSLSFCKLVGNLSLKKPSNLKGLDLTDCLASNDVGEELLASCNTLTTLILSEFALTQNMVNSVCENSEHLKHLTLDASKSKRKKMLERLLDSCHQLEYLKLEFFSFSSKRIGNLCFKNHLTLQKLDFSSCYGLNLKSVKLIVDNCVEIKDLRLPNSQLSKNSLHYLVNNLTTKIEMLSLKVQINLNDAHILDLVERCKNLSILDLGSTSINDNSITGIINNLKLTLKELCVADCINISYSVLKKLLVMDQLRVLECDEVYTENLRKQPSNVEINEDSFSLYYSMED